MPIIQIDGPSLSKEIKLELIEKLTSTAHQVIGLPEQAFTVIIRENDPDNIGIGGKQLSTLQHK